MWANEAMNRLLVGDYLFASVLDVGCGMGEAAAVFRSAGKHVTATDLAVDGDYLAQDFAPHDLVWCSHVLEHQPNVGLFLTKLIQDCRDGGILAITVPPLKHEIVGGHVSLWNAGLLLYRLALTGLDCRDARVKAYGYNISVIVRNHRLPLPPLRWDSGDITALAGHLPAFAAEGFNGAIEEFNW